MHSNERFAPNTELTFSDSPVQGGGGGGGAASLSVLVVNCKMWRP